MFRLKYLFAAYALALTVGGANATTYNYEGPSFDSTPISSGYIYDPALGSNITGSVTFNSDTSAFSGQISTTIAPGVGNPDVLSLGLTSGAFSLNSSAFGSGSALFGLFGFNNGQITSWDVCGYSLIAGGCWGNNEGIAGNGLALIQVAGSIFQPADDVVQETIPTVVNGQTYALGARVNANCYYLQPGCVPDAAFGSWTEVAATPLPVTPVPEPGALAMFSGGLGLLGVLGWRRKRKGTAIAA